MDEIALNDNLVPRRKAVAMNLPGSIFTLIFLAIAIFVFAGANSYQPAQGLKFPQLTGRVVDNADILPPQTENQITQLSAGLEAQTGAQFVVATMPDLQGATIEDFGYQLGRFWGIGRKGYDDGILLLVAPNEREVRIEVGYGLEGLVTDAAASVIIENAILPAFKAGDMAGGTLAGAKDIAALIGDPGNKDALPAQGAITGGDGGNIRPPGGSDGNEIWLALIVMVVFAAAPLAGIVMWLRCLFNPAYGRQLVPRPRRNVFIFPGGRGGGGGGRFRGGGGRFGGGGSSGRW